jgi:hypothetical protein
MFDKIRDVLSKAFSKEVETQGYGNDDYAVFPPPVLQLMGKPAVPAADDVIGEHVTLPTQFFIDKGLTP